VCPYLGGGGARDLAQDDHTAALAGADLLSTRRHLHLGQGCGPGRERSEEGRERREEGRERREEGSMSRTYLLETTVNPGQSMIFLSQGSRRLRSLSTLNSPSSVRKINAVMKKMILQIHHII